MANTIGVQKKGISSISPAFKQDYIQDIVVETAVTAIKHGIGRIPRGYLIVDWKSVSASYMNNANIVSAWTDTTAYLRAKVAATSAKVLWL